MSFPNKNREKFQAISGEESSRMYGGISYNDVYKSKKDDYAIGTRGVVKKDKYKGEETKASGYKEESRKKDRKKKKRKETSEGKDSRGCRVTLRVGLGINGG